MPACADRHMASLSRVRLLNRIALSSSYVRERLVSYESEEGH